MFQRLILLATLICSPFAQAFDLGGLLNNTLQREGNRKADFDLVSIFKSIEKADAGTNDSNVAIHGVGPGQVVMYSRAGCGYCTKARNHMRNQGISFIEKDVGVDSSAQAELRGIDNSGGVPVLVMGKHNVRGFSESSFNSTYVTFQSDFAVAPPATKQAATTAPSGTSGYTEGDVLIARIAKVKLFQTAESGARHVGQLAKNEEVIYLGEASGRYLKVRGAEHEGWIDKAMVAKP